MLFLQRVVIIGAVISLFGSAGVNAGHLSDQLEQYIAGRGDDEFVRVVIIPVSDYNSITLKTSLTDQYRTRSERHRAGVEQLQAAAEKSQSAIKDRLREMETIGRATAVKTFWIANLIETEVAIGNLRQLAAEPTVDKIELYPNVTSIAPVVDTRLASMENGVQLNLRQVKADSAWAAGYNGRGRIVCSFDTGVDGLHPALFDNYRGNKGYPASECWYSGVDSSDYPHAFASAGSYKSHGTHTTGIMVGHDSDLVIGVAPGADWIAAVAIDVPGASIFECYQWAADPDGDPNTITDVPDVINSSWGIPGIGCSDILWQVIDNTEALGIVNIFAAGNEGPGAMTLRNPADRADDSLTNFAVGALNTDPDSVWFQSARGPSDCDSVSIKPNVMAPGQQIYSSIPGGGYISLQGTSAAAPHVSGAVAILRQKNPDATVDEIKTALLNSAVDLGVPGPDNNYGWGRIDIMEALRQIAPIGAASIQVAELAYPQINPGDAVSLNLALKNVGLAVNNIAVSFANAEAGLTVFTGRINFGRIERDSTVYGNSTLDLGFSPSAESGRFYSVDMFIVGDHYSETKRLSFFVGSRGVRTYFHHDVGRVKFTISNYGAFGFHANSFIPLGFDGYQLDRDTNDLFEAALLIGTDSLHVSDCAKNIAQEPDNDFAVAPGGSILFSAPGPIADQETLSRFNDSYAEHPLGLTIEQRTFGWANDPDNTFIILKYIITNNSKVSVNGIRVGLYLDWDIRIFYQNHGSFLPTEDIGYLCWSNGVDSADFRGVKVLNPEGLTNHRIYYNPAEVYFSNFTEARKYQGLAVAGSGTYTSTADLSHVTATGPFNLSVQQSDTATFAIIGGATWNDFMASAVHAAQKYGDIPTDINVGDNVNLPRAFAVYQNYPNPFNPTTTISFAIPQAGWVRVDIFDILGRRVREAFDGQLNAGEHALVWDGEDNDGESVASGVYFYRVRYHESSLTRKMLMMK